MTKKVLVFIFLSIMFLSMIIIFVSLKFSERSREKDYQKSVKQIPEPLPAPAPASPLLPLSKKSTEERRRLVQDNDEKENDYLEQSERTIKDIQYRAGVYKWEDEKGVIHFSENPPTVNSKEKGSRQYVDATFKAVDLVKNHPTLPEPDTGKMRSVEKRMIDARKSFFPKMTWRYEATAIGKDTYRVSQYVDNGREESFIRTWIVNISTNEITPENLTAKELYYQPPGLPTPPPSEMYPGERRQLVEDRDKKQKDYSEQLESILRDVQYSSSAADSYRAEQKLRALREQYMNDPKITVEELRKLDQAIDAVRAMRR